MEFLVRLSLDLDSLPEDGRDDLLARERDAAFALRDEGVIQRMWRLPDLPATLSIWTADAPDALESALERLVLRPWMTVEVTLLHPHYLEQS